MNTFESKSQEAATTEFSFEKVAELEARARALRAQWMRGLFKRVADRSRAEPQMDGLGQPA